VDRAAVRRRGKPVHPFDFPIRAHEVRARSTRKKIRSHVFHIASRPDLIRMKEIAAAECRLASDAQDLEFLWRN
jgi:hypothetical protein